MLKNVEHYQLFHIVTNFLFLMMDYGKSKEINVTISLNENFQ